VREVIERCQGVSGELALVRVERGHYEIVANGVFLTATYNRRSERDLARLGLAALFEVGDSGAGPAPAAADLRVLIGGLGVGQTLAATLADSRVGHVVVVELEPKIVAWNLSHFQGARDALADGRVTLVVGDIFAFLRERASDSAPFDLLLLDTDNGPGWLVRPENRAIYGRQGLAAAHAALRPGGVAAFWSAAEAPWFETGLARAGFAVTRRAVSARRTLPTPRAVPPDLIYLGRKAAPPCAIIGP
jgi:SAM-dependent methyltransferase